VNEDTKKRFQNRLLTDINRLCKISDKLSINKDKFDLVFDNYQRYRSLIHDRIEQGSDEKKEIVRMDRHKVASAFFCAILKASPIEKKLDANKFFERTANIQLALLFCSFYIIDVFNISDKNNSELDKLIYSRIFKLPKCKQSNSKDYITNFIMLVEDIQIQSLDIDSSKFQPNFLFVLSHLFFLLDVYSYQENFCITLEANASKPAEGKGV